MRVLILSLVLLTKFALSETVICVPISTASGPRNAQNILPVNCQFNNKTKITCYPKKNLAFPMQFPQRVYCQPFSLPTTTRKPTTVAPPSTPDSSFVLCLPISFYDGVPPNAQGIRAISCRAGDSIVYVCYPFGAYTFGQTVPIMCVLIPF